MRAKVLLMINFSLSVLMAGNFLLLGLSNINPVYLFISGILIVTGMEFMIFLNTRVGISNWYHNRINTSMWINRFAYQGIILIYYTCSFFMSHASWLLYGDWICIGVTVVYFTIAAANTTINYFHGNKNRIF